MNTHPMPRLLVVEDSDEDYETLLRIFRKLAVLQPVERCINAKECFDYLYATGKYLERKEADFPAIVLLDLNLPGRDGHAILRQIKAGPALKHLPIVILTTSTSSKHVQACYEEGASSYLVKAVDYATYEQTIRNFVNYWFHAVQLPLPGEVTP
jgi:CheY-like chemotaxis protein